MDAEESASLWSKIDSTAVMVAEIKGMLGERVKAQDKMMTDLTDRVRSLEMRVWFASGIGSAVSLFFGYLLHIWGVK